MNTKSIPQYSGDDRLERVTIGHDEYTWQGDHPFLPGLCVPASFIEVMMTGKLAVGPLEAVSGEITIK